MKQVPRSNKPVAAIVARTTSDQYPFTLVERLELEDCFKVNMLIH
jgi:hypothetical protein